MQVVCLNRAGLLDGRIKVDVEFFAGLELFGGLFADKAEVDFSAGCPFVEICIFLAAVSYRAKCHFRALL